MGKGSKAVPERWLEYTTIGKAIPRTRIICFKVPLKTEICNSLPSTMRFTPNMVMESIPGLFGVIDVTNTPRYYDREEFLSRRIKHEKILCPGHVVPPNNVVLRFQTVMKDFLNGADLEDKYVGVHCTHGVNRTGYLVCRYLIECRGFQPEEAIRMFGESRGHPIERENYLNDLKILNPKVEQPITQPRTALGCPVSQTTRKERYQCTEGPISSRISRQSSDYYAEDRYRRVPYNTENWTPNGHYGYYGYFPHMDMSNSYIYRPYDHHGVNNHPYFNQYASSHYPNRIHQTSRYHPFSSQWPYSRHNS